MPVYTQIFNPQAASQCRMDEMMRGERGWRELATMGDTMEQLNGRIEGFLWHKYHAEKHQAENKEQNDDWTPEKVFTLACISCIILFHHPAITITNNYGKHLVSTVVQF